jgi:hypothetical protein
VLYNSTDGRLSSLYLPEKAAKSFRYSIGAACSQAATGHDGFLSAYLVSGASKSGMASDFFERWCSIESHTKGTYRREILSENQSYREDIAPLLHQAVRTHYVDPDTAKKRLERLGYKKAAKVLAEYLPTTPTARSGDLGEILATEYVNRRTPFKVPLFRLRWKDGRNMALRGDDIIGIGNQSGKLQLLKAEVKSRRKLIRTTIKSALTQLRRNANRPSAHTMNYVIDRLLELKKHKTAALLEEYLDNGIAASELHHLLFTLSSNDPVKFFDETMGKYTGKVRLSAVGLVIKTHAEFIEELYKGITWQPEVK